MLLASVTVLLALARALEQRPVPVDEANSRTLILAVEDGRNPTAAELKQLVSLARGSSGRRGATRTQVLAIRALGRLERRDLIPVLASLLEGSATRNPAEQALVVVLRAHAGAAPDGEIELATDSLVRQTSSALVLRHLPYSKPDQTQLAEAKLLALAKEALAYGDVAAAFETLARRHRRLHALSDQALEFLRDAVRRSLPVMKPDDRLTPRVALAALAAAGRADEDIIRTGLRDRDEQVRRTALEALNGAGAQVDAAARTELTRAALSDPSFFVRYEAVRGWSRRETPAHGCDPLVDALADASAHVVLAAVDALGERCPDNEDITARLASEARTPPSIGDWQREAHAFAALARRAPDRAAPLMPAFISHGTWQVRMYAARAAAAMKDLPSLRRLAYDTDDNVREAALAPLRTLEPSNSEAAFVAALGRPDYQLLRSAAIAVKDASPRRDLLTALVEALERVTAERKDTSRDTRLALLERIRALGGRDQLPLYERLLKDFDPRVAAAAAEACTALSVKPCLPNPQFQPRPPLPTPRETLERVRAVLELDNGRQIAIGLDRELAPLACARFLRLAKLHYYDGLTFHRVVPNFVVQGGSPGANEYAGDGPFMRDELGGSHRRGTVGISTRGRDTGDAQIFINLVDNPRLDYEYTVFGSVADADLPDVDSIQEGTRILRINFRPY